MGNKNFANEIGTQSLLKGSYIFEAEYYCQKVEEYIDNPLIEALPPLFDDNLIIEKFTRYPSIDEVESMYDATTRYHIIHSRLRTFIQPLNMHFMIEKKLSTMIRQGYLARNPNSIEYLQRLQLINQVKKEAVNKNDKLQSIGESLRSTAESTSIIGISGIGKTTAIERLLLMYPQVIMHKEYKGKPMIRTQIVWMKIDCPYDGSLKTLCKTFFRAVDDVLGNTNYYNSYGNNRNSTSTMMIHMTYVAALHSIGVLVIDEIQHLLNGRNTADEMLSFFVTLTNTIGVPTILIGTIKAFRVLTSDFRQARRASENGVIIWDRMSKDDEWDFFIETIWEFQWLKDKVKLNPELNDAMYDESQGITSVAVNLFLLAQERALESGKESISVTLIREVAKKDLALIQNMIKALRNNDINELIKYEDIALNINEILLNKKPNIDLRGKINEIARHQQTINNIRKHDIQEQVASEITGMGIFNNINYDELIEIIKDTVSFLGKDEELYKIKQEVLKRCLNLNEKMHDIEKLNQEKKIKKNKGDIKFEKDDLRKLFMKAEKEKRDIYEVLVENGYIKNPVNEFLEDLNIC